MPEENELRRADISEPIEPTDRGVEGVEQHKIDVANAHPERIKISETEHNPNLSIPDDLKPVVESGEDESLVQVPQTENDAFSEEKLMGTDKSPLAKALENLLDHELDLNSASEAQENILNLSQQ